MLPFIGISSNQAYTFSPSQRVPVGAYGKGQALNMGVSGAGNKPFLGLQQSMIIDKFTIIYSLEVKWVTSG